MHHIIYENDDILNKIFKFKLKFIYSINPAGNVLQDMRNLKYRHVEYWTCKIYALVPNFPSNFFCPNWKKGLSTSFPAI